MTKPVIGGKGMSIGISEPVATAGETRHNPPELTVVVPTFNERDNIEPLFSRLECTLEGIVWEAVIVDDDSPDGDRRFREGDRVS